MNKKTVRQHYVWREYLRNFCFKKDTIYSMINLSKIVPNNLTNVAQERFFYKLHSITTEDLKFLNDFLNSFLKEENELKEYLKTVLMSYQITVLKETIPDKSVKELFEKEVQNDFFERHMTENESFGKKLISVTNLQQLKESFDTTNKFKTILFLAVQLVRTKKQREKLKESFKNSQIDITKFWLFISFTLGNIIAVNLFATRKHKISLLINESELGYITSDQPVINLEEETDRNGNALYFKLYIALTPRNSLVIDFESKENSFEEKIITDQEYVKSLNDKIKSNSDMFIFSRYKENLVDIINSI